MKKRCMRISAGVMALLVLSFQMPAFAADMREATVEIKKSAADTKISDGESKTSGTERKASGTETKTSGMETKASGAETKTSDEKPQNFTLLPEHIPVQQYEGGRYQVDVYGSFTQLKDGEGELSVVEDNRLLLKRGNMIPVSTEMDYLDGKVDQVVVDSITGGNNDSQYLSVLEENRRVEDYYEQLKWPEELSNAGIQEISSNLNTNDTVLMVRYTDNTVAAFNYVTGTMLFKDESEKKQLSFGEYVNNWMTEKWNNLFGPNTVDYEDILFLKGQLEKMPLDTELNGKLSGNGQNLSSGEQVYNKDANGLTGSKNVGWGSAQGSNTPGTGAEEQGKGAGYGKTGIQGIQSESGAAAPDGVPALSGQGQAGASDKKNAQGQTGASSQPKVQGQTGPKGGSSSNGQSQTGPEGGSSNGQSQTGPEGGSSNGQSQTGPEGGSSNGQSQTGSEGGSSNSQNQAGISGQPQDSSQKPDAITMQGSIGGAALTDTDQMRGDTQALERHMLESALMSGQDLNTLIEDGIFTDALLYERLANASLGLTEGRLPGNIPLALQDPLFQQEMDRLYGLGQLEEEGLRETDDGEDSSSDEYPEESESGGEENQGPGQQDSQSSHQESAGQNPGEQQENISDAEIGSKIGAESESMSSQDFHASGADDEENSDEKDADEDNNNNAAAGSEGNGRNADKTGGGAEEGADGKTAGKDGSLAEASLDTFLTVYNPETGKYDLYDTQEYLSQGGIKGNVMSISQKLDNMGGGRSLNGSGIFRNLPEWLGYVAVVMAVMLAALFFLKRALDKKLRI